MQLLSSLQTPVLSLANRIVMAPMTRCRVDNPGGIPNELMCDYYRQRASAGLIISEGVHVSPMAVGGLRVPGLFSGPQVAGWQQVTTAVHQAGGKIFAQLWHVGRLSHPDLLNGQLPLAPSAVNADFKVYAHKGFAATVTPRAMTEADIRQTVTDFTEAARNAILAGFDGVEIHAANGYLFHQFFAKCSNTRTDDYGGSIPNRCRFLLEVTESIGRAIGISKTAIRLSPSLDRTFGIRKDDETESLFSYLATTLNDYRIAYLHISGFTADSEDSDPGRTILETAARYRELYKGTYMINKGFTRDTAESALRNGLTDLVSFGELFIANPDLAERFRHQWPLNQPDRGTYYTPGAAGYTDYPFYPG